MEMLDLSISEIVKRDGSVVAFNFERIVEAIFKAAQAVGGDDRQTATNLAHQVIERLQAQTTPEHSPNVEQIQDTIEKTLIEAGHAKTAKAFILYRQRHKEIREIKNSFLAVERTVDEYLQGEIHPDSIVSFKGLMDHTAQSLLMHYALNKIYSPQISEAHRDEMIHIHGLGHAIAAHTASIPAPDLSDLPRLGRFAEEISSRIIFRGFKNLEQLKDLRFLTPDPDKSFYADLTDISSWDDALGETVPKIGFLLPLSRVSSHKNRDFRIAALGDAFSHSAYVMGLIPVQNQRNQANCNLGTVSLNLPKMALEAAHKKDFFRTLSQYLNISKEALTTKKKIFEKNFDLGLFQETRHCLGRDISGFLSISPSGLLNAATILEQNGKTVEILKLARETLNFIQETLRQYEKEVFSSFALDFVSSCSFASSKEKIENLATELFQFPELLPFKAWSSEESEQIKALSAEKGLNGFAWVSPSRS
jgi:transcriptional regulator NrdR family protein